MGDVQYTLAYPFEDRAAYLAEKDGQDDGSGKTKDKAINIEEHGISQDIEELGGPEKTQKVSKTHPFAAPYTVDYPVIFKGYNGPIHGDIMKNDIIGYRNNQKQVEPGISAYIFTKDTFLSSVIFQL
jgi:hypothetical protein